jgi:hypothetical protein
VVEVAQALLAAVAQRHRAELVDVLALEKEPSAAVIAISRSIA